MEFIIKYKQKDLIKNLKTSYTKLIKKCLAKKLRLQLQIFLRFAINNKHLLTNAFDMYFKI